MGELIWTSSSRKVLLYQTGFCSVLADKSYKMGLVRKGKQRKKKKKKIFRINKIDICEKLQCISSRTHGFGKEKGG